MSEESGYARTLRHIERLKVYEQEEAVKKRQEAKDHFADVLTAYLTATTEAAHLAARAELLSLVAGRDPWAAVPSRHVGFWESLAQLAEAVGVGVGRFLRNSATTAILALGIAWLLWYPLSAVLSWFSGATKVAMFAILLTPWIVGSWGLAVVLLKAWRAKMR